LPSKVTFALGKSAVMSFSHMAQQTCTPMIMTSSPGVLGLIKALTTPNDCPLILMVPPNPALFSAPKAARPASSSFAVYVTFLAFWSHSTLLTSAALLRTSFTDWTHCLQHR